MKYTEMKVLSANINNLVDRTRFMSIADAMDLMEAYAIADSKFTDMIEESINQSIGKIATKEVTGLLGRPLSQVMSASVLFQTYLSDADSFELHAIEQIGVQFKNIAKRGLWEKDPIILSAIEVATKYGIEDVVLNAISIVRGRADISAVLEDTPTEETNYELVFETAQVKVVANVDDDFNFSNL